MRASLVLLAIGCGSKKEPPPAPAPAPTPKQVAPADAGKPPPSKEQLADYKKHMKAGWAQQKDKKWADAVKDFEAALVALPADQRALSELGWSAMNAGDFIKARKADEEGIIVAIDPKVQATAYYNLGLVQEKTGDKDGARRSFTLSLALRPNKTVHDELDNVGGAAATTETTCDAKRPCACVAKLEYGDTDEPPACSEGTSPIPGWQVVHVQQAHWDASADYLLDPKGVVAGQIGGGNFHGRHVEEQKLDKAEIKTISGHKLLWLQTTAAASTTLVDDSVEDIDAMGEERVETTTVTLCLLDAATTCPLRDVPIHFKHDYEPAHGKASHSDTTAELTIADDGTATVKLVKGASDGRLDAVIGPHKLW